MLYFFILFMSITIITILEKSLCFVILPSSEYCNVWNDTTRKYGQSFILVAHYFDIFTRFHTPNKDLINFASRLLKSAGSTLIHSCDNFYYDSMNTDITQQTPTSSSQLIQHYPIPPLKAFSIFHNG